MDQNALQISMKLHQSEQLFSLNPRPLFVQKLRIFVNIESSFKVSQAISQQMNSVHNCCHNDWHKQKATQWYEMVHN